MSNYGDKKKIKDILKTENKIIEYKPKPTVVMRGRKTQVCETDLGIITKNESKKSLIMS